MPPAPMPANLPGRFGPRTRAARSTPMKRDRVYRMGYFLGDGTGAGKGRQVASVILDRWLSGERRHIWISKNEALLEDARRDWTALGGLPLDIQPLSQWKLGTAVTMARASCSSPIRLCARAGLMRPGSTSCWTGRAKASKASSSSMRPTPWPMRQAARAAAARSRAPSRGLPACGCRTCCRAPGCSMLRRPGLPTSTIWPMRPGLACGGRRQRLRTARTSSPTFAMAGLQRWNWSRATSSRSDSIPRARCLSPGSNTRSSSIA